MIRLILLRFCESLFRNFWLYLLPVALMVTLAIVYVLVKPPAYLSSGTFYIQDESLLAALNATRDRGFSFTTPSDLTVDELNELFNSAAFLRAVAQQTDLEEEMSGEASNINRTLSEINTTIWADSAGERMVYIGSMHEDPAVAYQLAQSTMDTYVQWKINVSQNESAEAQRFFSELIDRYSQELEPIRTSLTDYLLTHPEPVRGERPAVEVAEIERIQADLSKAEERIADAEGKEENARLALTQAESDVRQTYLIFDSPTMPIESTSSLTSALVTVIVFTIAGLFLSVIGIIGGAFLSRSLLFPLDVQQSFELPVLASIPQVDQTIDAKLELLRTNNQLAPQHMPQLQNHDFTLELDSYNERRNATRNVKQANQQNSIYQSSE